MSDLYFPLDNKNVSWGSKLSQSWSVTEQKTASGRRRTLCQQTLPAWVFTIEYPALTADERDTLLGFYGQCRGKWQSFFYKDATIYRAEGQALAQNDDGTYQCVIVYGGYSEAAEKVDNLTVYVDGVATTDYVESDGKILVSGSGTVTADYDYYWKVCFADSLSISEKFIDYYSASLKLEVVRE